MLEISWISSEKDSSSVALTLLGRDPRALMMLPRSLDRVGPQFILSNSPPCSFPSFSPPLLFYFLLFTLTLKNIEATKDMIQINGSIPEIIQFTSFSGEMTQRQTVLPILKSARQVNFSFIPWDLALSTSLGAFSMDGGVPCVYS